MEPFTFYAVTKSGSLYEAFISSEEAKLTKKASTDPSSKVRIGDTISVPGTIMGIAKNIIFFIPEGGGITSYQRQCSSVNTRYWQRTTNEVVALFKEETDATFCLENYANPLLYKEQWEKSTVSVLQSVDENHPLCAIEESSPTLWLIPPNKWRA